MRGGSRGMARGMTPHTPSVPEDATGRPLTKRQIAALALLPAEPGRFLVNWRPILGRRGYLDLRDRGLIDEQWTWASGSRPDTGITPAGRLALSLARGEQTP